MKKFITLILVVGWVFTSYSQKVIQLEETRLNFDPSAEIVFEDYANGIVKVKEKFSSQFHSNAISFMKKNFDVARFLEAQGLDKGGVIVTAKSSKGFITATYNDNGEIVSNFQRFKDIPLPYEVRNQVYSQFQGWTMVSNKYVASGFGEQIDKEKYSFKLEKGKKRTTMKIIPGKAISGVASTDY
ncbi:hypothetical protein [Christiangramia sp.]|uniref:hypothetical protein n=1 Tax=Christiangramia sp. TaxID=1931228 RepID=UPI00260C8B7E|nr:hypothetical protein [Christiangramia sp.]